MRWRAPLLTQTAPRRPRLRPATASCPPCRPLQHGRKARATRHWPAPASAFAQETQSGTSRTLPGPTGERNVYTLAPRAHVLCVATSVSDLLVQTAAVLASGGKALWPTAQASLRNQLPAPRKPRWCCKRQRPHRCQRGAGRSAAPWRWKALQAVCTALAQRPGPIVGVTAMQPGAVDIPLERLLIERAFEREHRRCGR